MATTGDIITAEFYNLHASRDFCMATHGRYPQATI